MTIHGAIPYPGVTYQEPPDFTLYGDGHAIYKGNRPRELAHAQLTESQIQQVISRALDEGRLLDARPEYGDVPVTDMETTVFEINARAVRRTVSGYALGWDQYTGPDPEIRIALEALRIYLQRFVSVVDTGGAADLGAYQPAAYQAELVTPWWGEAEPNAPWPWPQFAAADFKADANMRVRTVSPEQAEAVLEIEIENTVVARAPEGDEYVLRVRPLLPDQHP